MRKVKLTKSQFDHMFFPNVTNVAAENELEFETSIRLIKKIRDPNKTEPRALSDQERRSEEAGARVYPLHLLRREQDSFMLEEDEQQLALKRLKVNFSRIPPLMGAEYHEMFLAVKDAEAVEPKEATPKKSKAKAG